jgi:hypothetical protein
MKLIQPTGKYAVGKCVKVSDSDHLFLSSLKWHVSDKGYAKTYYQGKHVSMHHLIVGRYCDHWNGDRLDNTRENLRKATTAQNNANVAPRGKSGYKGVSRDKTTNSSWKASISVDGKMVHLGNFQNPHHAALAIDLWLIDLHGEFARTNFPVVSSSAYAAGLNGGEPT